MLRRISDGTVFPHIPLLANNPKFEVIEVAAASKEKPAPKEKASSPAPSKSKKRPSRKKKVTPSPAIITGDSIDELDDILAGLDTNGKTDD
jgi:hypothetical protein